LQLSPPLKEDGTVEPHDHPDLQNADLLIRRVSEHFVVTGADGNKRLSTKAFEMSSPDRGGGMSVDVKKLIEAAGIDPREFVTSPRWTGSLLISVGDLRDKQLLVGYSPIDENPYHGEAWGKLSRGQKNDLLARSTWFVQIPGCSLAA